MPRFGRPLEPGPHGRVEHSTLAQRVARRRAADGTPLRPGGVTAAFEVHVRDCGLPVIRLHDTRHGACSLLLAGGIPIEIVQMILGHSSPEVTRKVYAHLIRKVAAVQVETATELLTKHRRRAQNLHANEEQRPVSGPLMRWARSRGSVRMT